jgi:hypothetical protein
MNKARVLVLGACGVGIAAAAYAQRMDSRSPLTLTVGALDGPEATVRGNAHRDGLARSPFPHAPIHIDLHLSVGGGQVDQPPIVTRDAIIAVTSHGDVVWMSTDTHDGGGEIARQGIGVAVLSTSAPTLLSNGTVVVVGGGSESIAVGVDKNGLRFRTQLTGNESGTDASDAVTPLALDDGGIAIATSKEIVLLDSAGNVRASASLPEALSGPLLASGGAQPSTRRILATSKTGVVYAWSPGGSGGREVTRVGSFQQSPSTTLQGGAVLEPDGNTLIAVVDDTRLMTLDLRQGLAVPLSTFANGSYLGPVAFRRGVAYAMAGVTGRTFVVAVDASGQEVLRTQVATQPITTGDGGPILYIPPAHVPVAVDDTGTVAFAAPEGAVGIVDPAGIATSLENVCSHGLRNARGVTALVSAGPGAFVVACQSGTIVRIARE